MSMRHISRLLSLLAAVFCLLPEAAAQSEVPAPVRACAKVGIGNYPPTANDDYAAWSAGPATIDALANDADVDHDPLTIISTTNGPGGSAAVINNGTAVRFTPSPGATSGQFSYTITDGNNHTSSATVFLTELKRIDFTYSCAGSVCTFTATPIDAAGIRSYLWEFGDGPVVPWTGINIYHEYPPLAPNVSHTYSVTLTADYTSGERGVVTKQITITGLPHEVTWRVNANYGMTVSMWLLTSNLPHPTNTTRYRYFMAWPEEGTREEFVGDPYASGFPFGIVINHQFPEPGERLAQVETRKENLVGTTWVPSTDPNDYEIFGRRFITVFNAPPDPRISATAAADGKTFTFDASQSSDDTAPFTLDQYDLLWDFGDGEHATGGIEIYWPAPMTHYYRVPGNYTASFTIVDHRANVSRTTTRTITSANAPPVPKVRVQCRLLDCTFGPEPSTDDGDDIRTWQWSFPDGTFASGPVVTKSFAAPGCINVSLTETDDAGNSGTGSQIVVVGPPLFAQTGGVTVDTHVQSFQINNQWLTSDGNRNGIAEPGETVVVEPNWPATAPLSATTTRVSLPGDPPTTDRSGDAQFVGNAATFAVSHDKADCWTGGQCYAVTFPTGGNNQHDGIHRDYVVEQTDATTGQPVAGGAFTLHLGKTFTDVLPSHWAYPFVESALHDGLVTGCGGSLYCPTTQLTRADAAVWVLRGAHGTFYQPPACTTPPFNDVPCSHPLAAWISQLKAEGLTAGTGGGNYSPAASLTRAEATIFILRARLGTAHVPPPCRPDFGDVQCPGDPFADWISEAKALGVSNGCEQDEYCPGDPVDRAQAAALFTRGLNLRIDAKQCGPADPVYDTVSTHTILPAIVSLTFSPSPVVTGTTSIGTITLGAPPAVPAVIPLSIDSNAASIPATVTVPAYRTVATFTVTPANVTVRTTTNISATYRNVTKTTRLDVCTPPPSISIQPSPRIINTGQTASFSVTASGGGTLTYQWYQGVAPNGTPVGTNSNSYTTPPLTASTSYWVNVSNACSSTASITVPVTVCIPPSIVTQPYSQIISSGTSTTLDVVAAGSAPLTYQWYEGTAGVTTTPVGTNSNSYTTPILTSSKSYWVRVTSTCNGTQIADSAAVTITAVTQITRVQSSANAVQSMTSITTGWPHPTHAGNLLVAIFSAANNSAIGAFTAPAGWQLATSYEWNNIKTAIYYYPNSPAGRTSETFATAWFRDQILQLAEYTWVATASPLDRTAFDGDHTPPNGYVSSGNTIATAVANELVVTGLVTFANTSFTNPTPGFTKIQEQTVGNDLTAALHERIVTTTGVQGMTAAAGGNTQWLGVIATFRGGSAPPAPITALTFNPSPAISGGTSTGTITLNAAPAAATSIPLSIDNPAGATIPASVTVNAGQTSGTFTVNAATVSARAITNITATYLGYPKTTRLDVCPAAPVISAHPTSRTINSGQPTTFSVTATGAGTLTYQWYQGTAPSIATPVGTNSNSLTVTPAATTSYWVSVSNSCSATASNTATVTVCLPLGIATQPASQTVGSGTSATLSVVPSGSGPFTYQWFEGTSGTLTTPVGTNSSTFTTPVLTASKSYWVRITGTCNGTSVVNSNTAAVTVVSQITRVQTAAATAQSLTSISVNWPVATHSGNLLVAVISASGGGYPVANFTFPAGWQLANTYEMNSIKTSIYYYPNNPGGRASETVTTGVYRDYVLQVAEYAGVAAVSPLDRTAFDGDNTASGSINSGTTIATSQAKELVITAMNSYSVTSFTSPTNGFSRIQEQTIGWNLTGAMFEKIVTAAGKYEHSASVGSPAQWVGLIVTFKSADTSAMNVRRPAEQWAGGLPASVRSGRSTPRAAAGKGR